MNWRPNKKHTENKPSSYLLETDQLRIKIFRDGQEWFISCRALRISGIELKSSDDNEAMQEALSIVTQKLKDMLVSIDNRF